MAKRKWVWLVLGGAALCAAAVGFLSHANAADGGAVKPAVTAADPVAHLTRLQLDAFELTCTYEQLARFELDAVGTGQPSTVEVLQRLGQLGTARLMLRYDNVVDLAEEATVSTGMHVPAVQDVVISSSGNIIPNVSFERVGFIGSIVGAWLDDEDPMQAQVRLRLECTDLGNRNLQVAENVNVPIFTQRLLIEETRVLRSQEPIWIACNELQLAAAPDGQTKMTVIRLKATRLTD